MSRLTQYSVSRQDKPVREFESGVGDDSAGASQRSERANPLFDAFGSTEFWLVWLS